MSVSNRDQGEPDQPPGQTASGQEVVPPGLLVARGAQRDHHDKRNEATERDEIEGGQADPSFREARCYTVWFVAEMG